MLATIVVAYLLRFRDEHPAGAPVAVAESPVASPSATVQQIGQNRSEPSEPHRQSRMDDPFEFIRSLSKAAYDGDGEAQYQVAKAFDKCEVTLSLVRKSDNPEAAIWELGDRSIAEFKRCSRLLRENPFADLPLRAGGYTYKYWMGRATEANYPLAIVEKAVDTLTRPAADSGARVEARGQLAQAMLSGNPDALLLMGSRMMFSSDDAERRLQGAAWMLAGCNAGADCGFDSAIYPFWMCFDLECQPGMNVELTLGRALSHAEFAQAYARYQHIAEELRNRNVEVIESLLGF